MAELGKLVHDIGYEVDKILQKIKIERDNIQSFQTKIADMKASSTSREQENSDMRQEIARLEENVFRDTQSSHDVSSTANLVSRRLEALDAALRDVTASTAKVREERKKIVENYYSQIKKNQDYIDKNDLLKSFIEMWKERTNQNKEIVELPNLISEYINSIPEDLVGPSLLTNMEKACCILGDATAASEDDSNKENEAMPIVVNPSDHFTNKSVLSTIETPVNSSKPASQEAEDSVAPQGSQSTSTKRPATKDATESEECGSKRHRPSIQSASCTIPEADSTKEQELADDKEPDDTNLITDVPTIATNIPSTDTCAVTETVPVQLNITAEVPPTDYTIAAEIPPVDTSMATELPQIDSNIEKEEPIVNTNVVTEEPSMNTTIAPEVPQPVHNLPQTPRPESFVSAISETSTNEIQVDTPAETAAQIPANVAISDDVTVDSSSANPTCDTGKSLADEIALVLGGNITANSSSCDPNASVQASTVEDPEECW